MTLVVEGLEAVGDTGLPKRGTHESLPQVVRVELCPERRVAEDDVIVGGERGGRVLDFQRGKDVRTKLQRATPLRLRL